MAGLFHNFLRIISSFLLPEYLSGGMLCFRTNSIPRQPFHAVAVEMNPLFVLIPRKTRDGKYRFSAMAFMPQTLKMVYNAEYV